MKSSKTFGIRFWLKKNAKNKNGELPIYARITINKKRAHLSLKRSIEEKYWSITTGRVIHSAPNSTAINRYINSVYSKLEECHSQLYQENSAITCMPKAN